MNESELIEKTRREMQEMEQYGMGPEALVKERKSQHGDWKKQSTLAAQLKAQMHRGSNWAMLEHHQAEALDMIAVKISRILTGNANHADHWDDIGGYALLGKGGHQS